MCSSRTYPHPLLAPRHNRTSVAERREFERRIICSGGCEARRGGSGPGPLAFFLVLRPSFQHATQSWISIDLHRHLDTARVDKKRPKQRLYARGGRPHGLRTRCFTNLAVIPAPLFDTPSLALGRIRMGLHRSGTGAPAGWNYPSVLHVRLPLPQQEPKSRSYACIPLCCVGLRSPLDLQGLKKNGSCGYVA